MRKILLFLFILVLFGILSAQSFAVNYGCGENIPPYVCGAAPPPGQYTAPAPPAPRYYGGVSVDPVTREYAATWNYTDGESAKYDAAKICAQKTNSNRCISYWASFYYTAVAISSDDKVTKFGSSDSYDNAWNSAIKECQNAGGYDCEVILMTSNSAKPDEKRWGSLSYDTKTGKWGKSWNQYTRREAVAESEKFCGEPGCSSLGFQSKYAAMAMSPTQNLMVGTSSKSMKEAEKEAIKRCKKEFKAKSCEIVVQGMAESEYK